MKKWFLLLAAALLLNTVQANAQASFYTNKADRYYHAYVDCDCPDTDAALAGGATEIFERKAYQKYEISAVGMVRAEPVDRRFARLCRQ